MPRNWAITAEMDRKGCSEKGFFLDFFLSPTFTETLSYDKDPLVQQLLANVNQR